MDLQNSFFAFFDSKNAQIKKKRPSYILLFNFKQLLFYGYPQKMPLSTLKLQSVKLTFSAQATLTYSTCSLDNIFDQNEL